MWVFWSFGLEKADYFWFHRDICLLRICEFFHHLVQSHFWLCLQMWNVIIRVMGPHHDNNYTQDIMLAGGITLLVSITCNSSHDLCLHFVGHRANLEAHRFRDSVILVCVQGNPSVCNLKCLKLQRCSLFWKWRLTVVMITGRSVNCPQVPFSQTQLYSKVLVWRLWTFAHEHLTPHCFSPNIS